MVPPGNFCDSLSEILRLSSLRSEVRLISATVCGSFADPRTVNSATACCRNWGIGDAE